MTTNTETPTPSARPVSVRDFIARKQAGQKLVLTTAYDALFGRLVDEAGVDAILVGDSLGMVIAGLPSTIPVTLDQMIYHASMVRRGVTRALLIVDMPFLTYQVSEEQALRNCGRVIQETGAQAVKLEGASDEVIRAIRALVRVGIPVMGHLGFTPQSVLAIGGHRVQGREKDAAERLIADARRLEAAGVFALVLELMPADVAAQVTGALTIPTIGIGAGPECNGQVLVLPDLLGLNDKFSPKFLKRFGNLADQVRRAVSRFGDEVRQGRYPDDEHSF
ncbi:MAG TPA: 3-methyl-2-oxobutanoate hydroxymethyltransferase [Gemmatimonadaceae bacterium]|nr:3-methyl-2-oxobutanoate hydroxymethyltransferase [Gemmatimonadaceae bacterium]